MSLQSPRTSMFTFQSAVHSCHVLQSLNQQRQKDVLCDVTVVVEGSSFRAHGAVLASCSDYFHSRITRHDLVIVLPDEVTVEGFEPLLQFAYTSKLLFTKENIQAVHTSAGLLGFHNLETACFDFLIPKFSDRCRSAPEDRRRACCKSKTPSVALRHDVNSDQPQYRPIGQKTGSDISQCSLNNDITENLPASQNTVPPFEGNMQTDVPPPQCPLNPQSVVGNGREPFCLQNCASGIPPLSLCSSSSSRACPVATAAAAATEFCDGDMLEIDSEVDQSGVDSVDCSLPCELPTSPPENVTSAGLEEATGSKLDQTVAETFSKNGPDPCGPCPPNMSGVQNELQEQRGARVDGTGANVPISGLSPGEGYGERSTVEREVAEHLAKGFWPDLCLPHTEPLPLETMDHSGLGKAADFHWLKQLDLSSSTGDCPFLRDLGAGEAEAETPVPGTDSQSLSGKSAYITLVKSESETPAIGSDGQSQSEKSPYMSSVNSETPALGIDSQSQSEKSPYMSSVNSAEESDLDTDGDTEANNRRAQEVQLPFPVQQISSLSRSAFQLLLRRQHLTSDQLELVHDVRRRSKNRVAAQRCRKRKLDSIHKLEAEINTLRGEKERLMAEHIQLKQSMEETLQSLSSLSHSVCSEAGPEPAQLLAKLSSSEFPISALITPLASRSPGLLGLLGFLGKEGDPSGSVTMDICPLQGSPTGATTTAAQLSDLAGPEPPQPCPETEEEDPATENSRPVSIMDVCLDLNGCL